MRFQFSFGLPRDASGVGIAAAALVCASCLSAIPARAQLVPVVSYDLNNGDSGSWSYWDSTYTGSGSKTTNNAPLTGGTGFLTDGILPGPDWSSNVTTYPDGNTQPADWVGWSSGTTTSPTVTFNLGAPTSLVSAAFWLSNGAGGSVGSGGVSLPSAIDLSFSNDGVTFGSPINTSVTADPSNANARMITISTPLTAQYVRAQFLYANSWVFLGEAQFTGAASPSAAPEPGSIALACGALSAAAPLIAIRRRRRRDS